MVEIEKLKELKLESKKLKPIFNIGKNGLSESVIEQIRLYIKSNKICKIKFSKSFLDEQELTKKELSQKIAIETNSEVIDQVGNVVIIWKR